MMNFQQLVEMINDPVMMALFHKNQARTQAVPGDVVSPQATPAPEREAPLEYMPPIPPATPPLPTRKPPINEADRTQGYVPAGGFGATGDVTSRELEMRIRGEPSSNPFESGKATGLWDALQRGMEFQPAQPIVNMPERGTVDRVIEQAIMLGLPVGRLGAGLGAIRAGTSAAARSVPRVTAESAGGRAVRNYSKSGPWGTKTELQKTLTDQLKTIHRKAKAGKPDLLQGEALERRRRHYENSAARRHLGEKGRLDQEWGEVVQSGLLR